MAQAKGTNWTVIIAGGALFFSLGNTIISSLLGGTDKLDKRVTQIENDLTWKYLSKEIAGKDLGYINAALHDLKVEKIDKDVYEQKIVTLERIMAFQRERIMELERRWVKPPPP